MTVKNSHSISFSGTFNPRLGIIKTNNLISLSEYPMKYIESVFVLTKFEITILLILTSQTFKNLLLQHKTLLLLFLSLQIPTLSCYGKTFCDYFLDNWYEHFYSSRDFYFIKNWFNEYYSDKQSQCFFYKSRIIRINCARFLQSSEKKYMWCHFLDFIMRCYDAITMLKK